MEHCFKVALGMLFLVGYLQTAPITKDDLRIEDTKNDPQCKPSGTFISPTYVEAPCYTAALKKFMDGLVDAEKNCRRQGIPTQSINNTLETLDGAITNPKHSPNGCNTTWETRKEFTAFMDDLKSLAQNINRAKAEAN